MGSITQINNRLFIDGKEIIQPKSLFWHNTICQVNNKVYVNGKEMKDGKWKYTLKSIIHTIF